MIKHALIVPTKYINDASIGWKTDFILWLSHLLDLDCENEYAKAIKKSWKELYLDNGLFENSVPENTSTLLRKAELMKAKYVFSPDILYDAWATRNQFEQFLWLRNREKVDVKIAYVVQADTVEEYLEEFKRANDNPDISLIWMSILTIPHCWWWEIMDARIQAIKDVEEYCHPTKDVHLLWLGGWLNDLVEARNHKWIKSNDSCSAFMTWLYEKVYDKNNMVEWWKIKEKINFMWNSLELEQKKCIEKNIDIIMKICHE